MKKLLLPFFMILSLAGCQTLKDFDVNDIRKYGDQICTIYDNLKDQFPSETDRVSELELTNTN